jgi:hypothetical protein
MECKFNQIIHILLKFIQGFSQIIALISTAYVY